MPPRIFPGAGIGLGIGIGLIIAARFDGEGADWSAGISKTQILSTSSYPKSISIGLITDWSFQ